MWKNTGPVFKNLRQQVLINNIRNFSSSKILRADYYKTLGVKKDATQAEIKNAYFELTKLYHPDKIAATDENLAKFREILSAYEVLGNEQSRKLYDSGLLRDLQKQGIDVSEDTKDPIIQFYKQKQQSAFERTDTELDDWTRELYKKSRKSAQKKNEFYETAADPSFKQTESLQYYMLGFITLSCISLIIATHLKDHPIQKAYEKLFGSDEKLC